MRKTQELEGFQGGSRYARKNISVDASDDFERDSFLSRVFAELSAQVIPRVLRGQTGLTPSLNSGANAATAAGGGAAIQVPNTNINKLVYEEEVSENALKEIHNQRSLVTRAIRLAQEAELCGNWQACANYHRQLLTLAETRNKNSTT